MSESKQFLPRWWALALLWCVLNLAWDSFFMSRSTSVEFPICLGFNGACLLIWVYWVWRFGVEGK